eukprot:4578250-Pyramimonas_sp.AAC.1
MHPRSGIRDGRGTARANLLSVCRGSTSSISVADADAPHPNPPHPPNRSTYLFKYVYLVNHGAYTRLFVVASRDQTIWGPVGGT